MDTRLLINEKDIYVEIIPGRYNNFFDFLKKHNLKEEFDKYAQSQTINTYSTVEEWLEMDDEPGSDQVVYLISDTLPDLKFKKQGKKIFAPITIL